MDNTSIVMAMHGTPPNDYPREELAEFFRLHSQIEMPGGPAEPASLTRYAQLEAKVRAWPRTALNDPFHNASQQLAIHPPSGRDGVPIQQAVGHPVLVGFSEFCAPSVTEALEQAVATGAAQVIVVTPMMTRGGEHAEAEIPAVIAETQRRYPAVRFAYAWPFDSADIARFLAGQIARFL